MYVIKLNDEYTLLLSIEINNIIKVPILYDGINIYKLEYILLIL